MAVRRCGVKSDRAITLLVVDVRLPLYGECDDRTDFA